MTAFAFGPLLSSVVSNLDPERQRDKVWRDSYDENSPEAQPWRRVLDGSREAWNVVKNAALLTCREDINKQSRDAAALRRRGEAMDDDRLRVGDDRVLAAYLDAFHHETAQLFIKQLTVAEALGMGVASVNEALHRLQKWGYLTWVRRSRKKDTEGRPGPQREQASNATYFDWKIMMPPRTWSRFWQLVVAALKKIGSAVVASPSALFTRVRGSALFGTKPPTSSKRPGPRARSWLRAIRRAESTPA